MGDILAEGLEGRIFHIRWGIDRRGVVKQNIFGVRRQFQGHGGKAKSIGREDGKGRGRRRRESAVVRRVDVLLRSVRVRRRIIIGLELEIEPFGLVEVVERLGLVNFHFHKERSEFDC